MAQTKQYYTVKELAALMGVSRIAVFNRIKSGKIKAEKIGRNYIIQARDLPDMLNPALSLDDKAEIEKGVHKTLRDYGETLKKLGQE